MTKGMLRDYSYCKDGLYRKPVTFGRHTRILVRRPDGTLLRREKPYPKAERKRI